jgi:hypothetical protein
MKSAIHGRAYLRFLLPSNVRGITVVLENDCDGFHTYEINRNEAYVIGFGDQHDPKFDYMEQFGTFTIENLEDGTVSGIPLNQEGCPYSFQIYPTQKYYDDFVTTQPIIIMVGVAFVFLFALFIFFCHDHLVER